jgi:anti-sigma factor RsiW
MQHDHLSFEALVDLVEGRLEACHEDLAREHLAACSTCHSEFIRVEHLLAQMRVLGEQPRRNSAAWVRAIFRAAQRATVPRRVLSLPLFDSRLSMSAYGMRSSQATAERQVLFEAAPFTVDLRILPLSDQWTVAGQVLGPATSGTVTLLSPQLSREAELSHLGEFQLPAIPAARCTLVRAMATETLIMPELEVGG